MTRLMVVVSMTTTAPIAACTNPRRVSCHQLIPTSAVDAATPERMTVDGDGATAVPISGAPHRTR